MDILDAFHPEKVVKKIVPTFNKFVFFEVGVTSFHQVDDRLCYFNFFTGIYLARSLG